MMCAVYVCAMCDTKVIKLEQCECRALGEFCSAHQAHFELLVSVLETPEFADDARREWEQACVITTR